MFICVLLLGWCVCFWVLIGFGDGRSYVFSLVLCVLDKGWFVCVFCLVFSVVLVCFLKLY